MINGKRYRPLQVLLPEPWFLLLLTQCGQVGADLSSQVKNRSLTWEGPAVRHRVFVHALVDVAPGDCLMDPLHALTREEKLLLEYCHRAADACSLVVNKVFPFLHPVEVFSTARGLPLSLRHDIVLLGADGGELSSHLVEIPGGDVHLPAADIPAILVPEPLVALVTRKLWSALLVCAGRLHAHKDHPRLMRALGEMEAMLVKSKGFKSADLPHQDTPFGEVSLANISGFANRIRRWAKPILKDAETNGSRAQEELVLRDTILQLAALEGSTSQSRQQHYLQPAHVFHALRLMMQVRNRGTLSKVIEHALCMLSPSLVGSGSASWPAPPSASHLSRMQAPFDEALNLTLREFIDSQNLAIYVWADSSPQMSYDFFVSVMQVVRGTDLVNALDIANKLACTEVKRDDLKNDPEGLEELFICRGNFAKRLMVRGG